MSKKTKYEVNIQNRSPFRYYLGVVARLRKHLYYSYSRYIARKNGAIIGSNVVMPLALAKKANSNLIIGNNTSIQSDLIDLRAKINIGNNVIIGSGVEIITCSHEIDSPDWEFKPYGITIEDYVWIATRVFILPSCRNIGYGAICAAGSLVAKNVEKMHIVSGNPAVFLKTRKQVHTDLVVSSLLGGDLVKYMQARRSEIQVD
ncbi:acyltransferase [Flavobacterium sp. ANB]|uniref:acyltransferase n=1 Tax=unclassified Flavobacterium TaxID=196869 RepID=UPI0012B8A303|nr:MULTISPECIES: acyltransferase [unclassified Flavobacterium]MBF4518061.1 acyltransferase [Flavobacterium sp. ANB]MTD71195.1 acyltransferase [Flavobacterium sp. LC2016-13]